MKGAGETGKFPLNNSKTFVLFQSLFLRRNHVWCSQQWGLSVSQPQSHDTVCRAGFHVQPQWKLPWRKRLHCPWLPLVRMPGRVGLWAMYLRTKAELVCWEGTDSCGCCIHGCILATDLCDMPPGDGVKRSSARSSVPEPVAAHIQDFVLRKLCWWRERAWWPDCCGDAWGAPGCAAWHELNLSETRSNTHEQMIKCTNYPTLTTFLKSFESTKSHIWNGGCLS